MAYTSSQVIDRDIQGMIYSSEIGEEQGDLCSPLRFELESQFSCDERPSFLIRYPSTSNYDKDKALINSFCSNKKYKSIDDNVFPESEQLGIMIKPDKLDELERLSFDSDINANRYWQKPDDRNHIEIKNSADFYHQNHDSIGVNAVNTNHNRNEIDSDDDDLEFLEESKSDIDQFEASNPEFREIRWRKEDDKRLFSIYRNLWRNAMLNINDVVSIPLKKNKVHKRIIQQVGENVGWKGKTSMLSKRIKKILTNYSLSVREKQDLTRLYKKQVKQSELDWEKILYEFPGKTLIYIQEFWKQIKVKIKPQIMNQNRITQKEDGKVSKSQKGSQSKLNENQCSSQILLQSFKELNVKDVYSAYNFGETTLSK